MKHIIIEKACSGDNDKKMKKENKDFIVVDKKELKKEHKKLVKVLKRKKPKELDEEYEEQKKELDSNFKKSFIIYK